MLCSSCSACLVQEEVTPHEAYEHSEMLLYRAMVLDEGGHHNEALTHLDLCEVSLALPRLTHLLWGSQQHRMVQRAHRNNCFHEWAREQWQVAANIRGAC